MLDIQVIITGAIGIITTIVGSWTSYIFTKRKYNAEVDNSVIDNMKQSLDFYIKLSDDNKARLDEALKRNDALEKEIQQLRQQMFELMSNICYDLKCELRSKTRKVAKVKKGE
jgi:hypothetical protein